jgi:hypothetical protein
VLLSGVLVLTQHLNGK